MKTVIIILFVLCCGACRSANVTHGPVKISAPGRDAPVREALEFLREREPAIHGLVGKHVAEIRWKGDPFWSATRFPGSITLSTAALGRGKIYLASLVYHELNHIMLYKLRRPHQWPDDIREIERHYLTLEKIQPGALTRLSRFGEEKLIHELQLRFLVKYGDGENAELQELNIRQLDKTYRHLPR